MLASCFFTFGPGHQVSHFPPGLMLQIEEALQAGRQQVAGIPAPGSGSSALYPPAQLAQQALEGITRVAKGFSLRLCMEARPALGQEFLRTCSGCDCSCCCLERERKVHCCDVCGMRTRRIEVVGPVNRAACCPTAPAAYAHSPPP